MESPSTPVSSAAPLRLSQLPPSALTGELKHLERLQAAGLELAPLVFVPAEAEEQFYRSNALPARLAALFADVDVDDPDEDDIEELAPRALELLKRHFLLDEFIDQFYSALDGLPNRVRVRRMGEPGRVVLRGRPALIALKDTFAEAWTFDALTARLGQTRSIALEARPVLIGVGDDEEASPDLKARVESVLGRGLEVYHHESLGLTRLS